jgi:bifunctional non-homologous end joining protein LigD
VTAEKLKVGRGTVELSHPEKMLFPDDNITKGDLVVYYQHAAGVMLPSLRDRPVAMRRYPDGITAGGIMQKTSLITSRTGSPGRRFASRVARSGK